MKDSELNAAVLRALHRVAPEADLESIPPDADLREALDIDSIGILQFAAGLEAELGVSVPERDYPRLVTLAGALAYVESAKPKRSGARR